MEKEYKSSIKGVRLTQEEKSLSRVSRRNSNFLIFQKRFATYYMIT